MLEDDNTAHSYSQEFCTQIGDSEQDSVGPLPNVSGARTPSVSDIKSHVALLHTLALPFIGKGKLVVASFGEDPATRQKIPNMIGHFNIGDVDRMVAWILNLTSHCHRNIYIPMAVFRIELPPHNKGGEEDIIAVLGLTADFDDVHASDYAKRLPLPPDYVLETSNGRFQAFYFFKQAIDRFRAKQVAEQLQTHSGCDTATSDVSHVWRISGTLNYPNWKKVHKDGRSPVPQLVRVIKAYNGTHTDIETLEAVLRKSDAGQTSPPTIPRRTVFAPNIPLPAHLQNRDRLQINLGDFPLPRFYSPEYETEIRTALNDIPSDDYKVWITTGMAIHSLNWGETGLRMWDWWSRKSKKYDDNARKFTEPPQDLRDKWKGFVRENGEGVSEGTIYYYAKEYRQKNNVTVGAIATNTGVPYLGSAAAGQVLQPLFSLADAAISSFINTAPPPRNWLLERVFPKGVAGLLIAPGGTGKSQLMLEIAVAVALGTGVAKGPIGSSWKAQTGGSVLCLLGEDDTEEMHRRVNNTITAMKLNTEQKALLEKRLFVKSMVSENNFMTIANRTSREITPTGYTERLLEVCKGIPDLRLITLDPASRFRGGDEISNDDATRFVIELEKIVKSTGASVLVAHHVGKAASRENEPSQNAARGASALVDGVRWVCNLTVMTEAEARKFNIPPTDRKQYLQLMVTKNNYAPPQFDPIWLKRCEHGYLEFVILTTTANQDRLIIMQEIVKTVAADAAKGMVYSRSKFCKDYGGLGNRFKTGDKSLRGMVEQLIDEKRLDERPPATRLRNVDLVLVAS